MSAVARMRERAAELRAAIEPLQAELDELDAALAVVEKFADEADLVDQDRPFALMNAADTAAAILADYKQLHYRAIHEIAAAGGSPLEAESIGRAMRKHPERFEPIGDGVYVLIG